MDLKRAQIVHVLASMFVCIFSEDFFGLRRVTGAKVIPCGRFLENTLLKHVLVQWGSDGECVARDRSSHA